MATLGRPAVNNPRTADVREISAIISAIRERLVALESALASVSTVAAVSSTSSGTSAASSSAAAFLLSLDRLANGLLVKTSAATMAARVIEAPTEVTVVNRDGVSGNPRLTWTAQAAALVFASPAGASGAPSFRQLDLAGPDFAHQGARGTVLHGNEYGAPFWAAVDLATDVQGALGASHVSGITATQVVFGAASGLSSDPGLTWSASTLTAGSGINGSGLTFTIQPAAPTTAQNGGTMTVRARNATGAGKSGGGVSILAGNGLTTGAGGSITLNAGISPSGDGGQMVYRSGSGVTTGGNQEFYAGDSSGSGGTGGAMLFTAGNALGAGGTGGDLIFLPGSGATAGAMRLQSSAAGDAITITDDGTVSLMAFFGGAPVAQPTIAATAAGTFVAGSGGTAITTASTIDGWTLQKLVRAVRLLGAIA